MEELPFDPSDALEWDSSINDEDGLLMTCPTDGHDVQNSHAFGNDTLKDAQGPMPAPLFQIPELDEDSHYCTSSSLNPIREFGKLKINSAFSQDAQKTGIRVDGEERHEWTPYIFPQLTPPSSAGGKLLDDPILSGMLDLELPGSPAPSMRSNPPARHSPAASLRTFDHGLEIQIPRNQATGWDSVEIENSLSITGDSNLSPSEELLPLPYKCDNEGNVHFVDEPYLTALSVDIELYSTSLSGD